MEQTDAERVHAAIRAGKAKPYVLGESDKGTWLLVKIGKRTYRLDVKDLT